MQFDVFMGLLINGFGFTMGIFFVTLVGSLPLGVLVALARMSKFKPLSFIMRIYISFMRGTPLMLSGFGVMRVATPPFSRAVFSRLMPLSITER